MAEVEDRLALAAAADQSAVPGGASLPAEILLRQDRLAAIAAAKAKIEARAKERFEGEQADYEAKMLARTANTEAGKKHRGKIPTAPESGPRATDQINLTDEESRIMKVAGGGFEPCFNAQAVVDTESMLIIATDVAQACNDKGQVEPMVAKVQANPEGLNQPETWLADTGNYSAKNVDVCLTAKIEPLIAVARDKHHAHWRERFTEPKPLADNASPVEIMKHKLKTLTGRAACALRKQTVEPVFGIIKSVMGFRQFLLSGLDRVKNEWTPGLPSMEFEAHGHIASTVRK